MEQGEPSETTKRNIRHARAYSMHVGRYHVEWKFLTHRFFVLPHCYTEKVEFFNEGSVYWIRWYWLTFGVSMYRKREEGE